MIVLQIVIYFYYKDTRIFFVFLKWNDLFYELSNGRTLPVRGENAGNQTENNKSIHVMIWSFYSSDNL